MDDIQRIYKAIFKEEIPPLIRERYDNALGKLSSSFTEKENTGYQFALSRISDIEALEFAARRKKALPLLVFRFRLMVYLAESLPGNGKFFITKKRRKFAWPFSLTLGVLRSLVKLIIGILLLRKLENA